jgi:alkylation response protein AidB-like acyl-CoA dehydrogenase
VTTGTARPPGDVRADDVRADITALAARAAAGPPEGVWDALVHAGLVGLAVPERCGGDGIGPADAFGVLTEAGRNAVAVPALATLALGVLPVARWGTPEQQDAALTPVAAEGAVLTAALHEPSGPVTVAPRTAATGTAGGFAVSGVKTGVPYADRAHRMLVPAQLEGGYGVLLVDPRGDGVTLTPEPTSGDEQRFRVALDGAPVAAGGLLPGGADVLADLHRLAAAGAAATADGLVTGALALTAEHVRTREQFGRPLATFQAVAQHLADVYVTSRAVHLAARAAADAVERREGPDGDAVADPEVAAAWVTAETRAAIATCHHLHGGLGLDRSYPLHRFSAAATDLAHLLGGADHATEALATRLFAASGGDGA